MLTDTSRKRVPLQVRQPWSNMRILSDVAVYGKWNEGFVAMKEQAFLKDLQSS